MSEQEIKEQEQTPVVQEKPLTPKKPTGMQAFYKEMREILMILAVFMLIYVLFFRVVVVVGDSMNDTLVDGDRLLLISSTLYNNPKQGDIIVASKDSFRNGECIIKRVIATEGQVIDIDFETGAVYVDGEEIEELYISSPTFDNEGMVFPLTVAEGCVFVMGDNREDSMDSRSPQIGLIDEREILGKVIFLLIPGSDQEHAFEIGRIGVVN